MGNSNKILRLGNAGLRGIVGDGLDLDNLADFACAFATAIKIDENTPNRVLIGADNRKSSKMIYDIVVANLLAMNIEVIDGGVLTAGLMHFIINNNHDIAGGLLISGGHQKANWNSIIPLNFNGEYFNHIQLRELFDIYHSKLFDYANIGDLRKKIALEKIEIQKYFDYLKDIFDCELIKSKKFTVIGDFCDGAGGYFSEMWAEVFGIKLIGINDNKKCEILPRNPEPNRETGKFIASVIQELKADIGFVFNSDVSRTSIILDSGVALSEEMTCPLCLDYILENDKKVTSVISNICSTKTIDEIAKKHGREVNKTLVGESNIIEKMHFYNNFLGGEGSGTIAYGDKIVGFDGFFTATLIIEYLAKSGKSISELYEKLPKFYMIKSFIESKTLHSYSKLRAFKNLFHDCEVTELDGIRFDFLDGFLSLRFSNTEKIIRIISESNDYKRAKERIWFVKNKLEI